jgi:hypothetical protein
MTKPIEIDQFLGALAENPRVKEELAESKSSNFQEFFDSGELEDLIKNESSYTDTIQASGGPDLEFDIEIQSFGPVFWIQANEFDDIGYFATEKEAHEYALEEYAPYIGEPEEFDEDE